MNKPDCTWCGSSDTRPDPDEPGEDDLWYYCNTCRSNYVHPDWRDL